MRVAIVRVPTVIDAYASTAPICPPLGLAYLNEVAHRFTNDITVIDAIGNKPSVSDAVVGSHTMKVLGETAEEIAGHLDLETELVLISIMFSQDWPYARQVLREIKAKCPNAVIFAGGEHITAVPELSMNAAREIDLAVLGEGEATLSEILKYYSVHGEVPTEVEGTCVRLKSWNLKSNPRRQRIQITEVPLPRWDGFPLENYLSGGHGFGVNLGRSMPILATRGCPYRCTFCSSPQMWTTSWKAREPEEVLSEMKEYIHKYGATNFDFYDLTAIIRKDWIVKFAKLLIQNELNVTWQLPSGTRSEAIDKEVSQLLYASGCRNLSYAPESGSKEILRQIKKNISLEKMLDSMRACIKENLSVKMNIICGFPFEKPKHLWESFKFILRTAWIGIDDMSINQFSPYPGCELFDQLVRDNQLVLSDEYFESLSFYSSMTNARSYSRFLTNRDILAFKFVGTTAFYVVSFARRPWRIFTTVLNSIKGVERTRMQKAVNAFIGRQLPKQALNRRYVSE